MADAAPRLCVKLYKLFLEGKHHEARCLQFDFAPLNKAVVLTCGIPGLKHALDLQGYYGGPPRLPLLPVSEKGMAEFEGILKDLGLFQKPAQIN
jgi:4-hydroxy-2-oxoglutarate aldolase